MTKSICQMLNSEPTLTPFPSSRLLCVQMQRNHRVNQRDRLSLSCIVFSLSESWFFSGQVHDIDNKHVMFGIEQRPEGATAVAMTEGGSEWGGGAEGQQKPLMRRPNPLALLKSPTGQLADGTLSAGEPVSVADSDNTCDDES